MRRALVVLAAAAAALTLAGAAGARCKPYFMLGEVSPIVSADSTAYVHFDRRRIPVVRYPFGTYESPFVTAEWGLQNLSLWCRRRFADDGALPRTGWRARELREGLRMADYLARTQPSDGAWYYQFPFHAGNLEMRPPWPSAIAQGVAISLLARAYELTGRERYLRAATRALRPFTRTFRAHGVRELWQGHPWYEEYPGAGAQHVLNGFEFSLVGLHDLAPHSTAARRLFRAGVASLVWALPMYDLGAAGSSYAYRWGVASYGYLGYLFWHIQLGRALYDATGKRVLAYYADRWEQVLLAHPYDGP